MLTRLVVAIATVALIAASPTAAQARDRVVPPGGSFKLARGKVINEVRIVGGQKLRVRCVGDGCDWRRRHGRRILASISELDRVFRNHAPLVSLRVRVVRA